MGTRGSDRPISHHPQERRKRKLQRQQDINHNNPSARTRNARQPHDTSAPPLHTTTTTPPTTHPHHHHHQPRHTRIHTPATTQHTTQSNTASLFPLLHTYHRGRVLVTAHALTALATYFGPCMDALAQLASEKRWRKEASFIPSEEIVWDLFQLARIRAMAL
jgi:hypothetical protein